MGKYIRKTVVAEYNKNHGPDGRFTTGSGGSGANSSKGTAPSIDSISKQTIDEPHLIAFSVSHTTKDDINIKGKMFKRVQTFGKITQEVDITFSHPNLRRGADVVAIDNPISGSGGLSGRHLGGKIKVSSEYPAWLKAYGPSDSRVQLLKQITDIANEMVGPIETKLDRTKFKKK